jgi:hypothetical protein
MLSNALVLVPSILTWTFLICVLHRWSISCTHQRLLTDPLARTVPLSTLSPSTTGDQ